ncbi:ribonuclease H-like protein [Coprinellus micaceus]|uniref:ribonuclease H n=1 Tax=Coprinellus micaceus TaxID=71717 RepID=A0A4Y7SFR7_COPMI|nr:ribonuclease H-like protein [Coprinellus micaceus]
MLSKLTLEGHLNRMYGSVLCSKGEMQVYTDGSSVGNGTNAARAGAGVFFGVGNRKNGSYRVPGPEQTNNRGEIYAVYRALLSADPHKHLTIYTDSVYVINMLTEWAPERAAGGWRVTNGDIFRAVVATIKSRPAPVVLRQVKGHSGNAHNDAADELAKKGAWLQWSGTF